ncbi:hypothetical protein FOPG_18391 [Fusarium oxysporum f. sp. conglutinans race 2 54008]|uniref:Uncharacterized protein n=1 Tax=Fusarium oxysporum f. sp. conglutinans race 2 54008 TaxID=1089457 RepID=X0GZU4_FUSOX|nr:hypothetical protein FOPG_18391 [Fusarium oxysporum f. sp. conglutinans race 2 54008]
MPSHPERAVEEISTFASVLSSDRWRPAAVSRSLLDAEVIENSAVEISKFVGRAIVSARELETHFKERVGREWGYRYRAETWIM